MIDARGMTAEACAERAFDLLEVSARANVANATAAASGAAAYASLAVFLRLGDGITTAPAPRRPAAKKTTTDKETSA